MDRSYLRQLHDDDLVIHARERVEPLSELEIVLVERLADSGDANASEVEGLAKENTQLEFSLAEAEQRAERLEAEIDDALAKIDDLENQLSQRENSTCSN